jgi:error-prone DNA polymerase
VVGLRSETGHATEVERSRAGFESVADLARRVALHRDELDALAEVGALGSIDPAARRRRSALWQVAAVERDRNSLFAGISPPAEPSPLEELSPLEATLADYRTSGLTTGPHLLAHLRPELRRRGILAAAQLRSTPDGRFVRTAGHAIVRQRPRAAKGFCFLTLEDETGTSNAILTPDVFQRFRIELHTSPLVEVAGPLQNAEGVIHVRVRELRPLAPDGPLPESHDYR